MALNDKEAGGKRRSSSASLLGVGVGVGRGGGWTKATPVNDGPRGRNDEEEDSIHPVH